MRLLSTAGRQLLVRRDPAPRAAPDPVLAPGSGAQGEFRAVRRFPIRQRQASDRGPDQAAGPAQPRDLSELRFPAASAFRPRSGHGQRHLCQRVRNIGGRPALPVATAASRRRIADLLDRKTVRGNPSDLPGRGLSISTLFVFGDQLLLCLVLRRDSTIDDQFGRHHRSSFFAANSGLCSKLRKILLDRIASARRGRLVLARLVHSGVHYRISGQLHGLRNMGPLCRLLLAREHELGSGRSRQSRRRCAGPMSDFWKAKPRRSSTGWSDPRRERAPRSSMPTTISRCTA